MPGSKDAASAACWSEMRCEGMLAPPVRPPAHGRGGRGGGGGGEGGQGLRCARNRGSAGVCRTGVLAGEWERMLVKRLSRELSRGKRTCKGGDGGGGEGEVAGEVVAHQSPMSVGGQRPRRWPPASVGGGACVWVCARVCAVGGRGGSAGGLRAWQGQAGGRVGRQARRSAGGHGGWPAGGRWLAPSIPLRTPLLTRLGWPVL